MAGIKVVTPASGALFTNAELKAQCGLRAGNTSFDTMLSNWAKSAMDFAETWTGRSLLTRTLRQSWDSIPSEGCPLRLAFPPLVAVTSIEYLVDDAWSTFSNLSYRVDTDAEPGLVILKSGEAWPTVDDGRGGSVLRATFDSGFGAQATDVPQLIRDACLLLVAHWFENREATTTQQAASFQPAPVHMIPLGVREMLFAWSTGELK